MKSSFPILIVAILLLAFTAPHSERFENKSFHFSMDAPPHWQPMEKSEILDNLDNVEMDKEMRRKVMKDTKGSLMLASWYKYDRNAHAGLIPAVQVNVRAKDPRSTFDQFKVQMTKSAESFKAYFPDFAFEVPPTEVEISGIRAVYFIGTFTMNQANGPSLKSRSRTYAIPMDDHFFQISMNDGQEDEMESELFDAMAASIKIDK